MKNETFIIGMEGGFTKGKHPATYGVAVIDDGSGMLTNGVMGQSSPPDIAGHFHKIKPIPIDSKFSKAPLFVVAFAKELEGIFRQGPVCVAEGEEDDYVLLVMELEQLSSCKANFIDRAFQMLIDKDVDPGLKGTIYQGAIAFSPRDPRLLAYKVMSMKIRCRIRSSDKESFDAMCALLEDILK